jgi:hypothetical protein
MKKITLAKKIYTNKKNAFWRIKEFITREFEGLDVTISSLTFTEEGYISLILEGEDEEIAYNFLVKVYGKVENLDKLQSGDIVKGYIVSSGEVGFGLFVDIGVKEPYKVDALVPLFALRNQLMDGNKVSVRKIIQGYGLVDNFPIEICIEEVSIGLKKIEAKLAEEQVTLFNRWKTESLDRLIVLGAFEEEIERALRESNHRTDIINIEQLGLTEYALTCKFNTNAKGLIPAIGRRLPKAKLEIFSPRRIRELQKQCAK